MEWVGDNLWLAWMALALGLGVGAVVIALGTVTFATMGLLLGGTLRAEIVLALANIAWFVMLGVGALFGGLSAALGASLTIQIVVAAVTSMLLVWVVRPAVKRQFLTPEASTTIGSAALTGRRAHVLEKVTDRDGRVRLAGETWSARVRPGAAACEPGQEVRVLEIDGATAIITDEPLPDTPAP